jgi:hypothetical protein
MPARPAQPLTIAALSTEWALPGCSRLSVAPLESHSIVGSTCLRRSEIGRSRQTSRGAVLDGSQQIRICNLSLTFRMARYVPHLMRWWPILIERLLVIGF